jgi:hypothetical protein
MVAAATLLEGAQLAKNRRNVNHAPHQAERTAKLNHSSFESGYSLGRIASWVPKWSSHSRQASALFICAWIIVRQKATGSLA